MVDLGVYNFVKNALAQGKSKEDIIADFSNRGTLTAQAIEEVFIAVASGAPPAARRALDMRGAHESNGSVPVKRASRGYLFVLWLAIFFALIGGISFALRPEIFGLQGFFKNVSLQYQANQQTIPVK